MSDASAAGTAIRPSGTVSFSKAAGDAGSLGAASCTLPATGANECSVTYTPSAAGSSTITGSYGGDTNHLTSSDDDTVTAAKRDSDDDGDVCAGLGCDQPGLDVHGDGV